MNFDQNLMALAKAKGKFETPEYKVFLINMLEVVRENGTDKVMIMHQLDAFIAPTRTPAWKTDHINGDAYHVGSSYPVAISSYLNITKQINFIDGLPVGISFFDKAWRESLLLEIASAYEAGTKIRKSPKLK